MEHFANHKLLLSVLITLLKVIFLDQTLVLHESFCELKKNVLFYPHNVTGQWVTEKLLITACTQFSLIFNLVIIVLNESRKTFRKDLFLCS